MSYLRLAGNNSDVGAFVVGAEGVTVGYASKLGRLDNVEAVGTIDRETGRVSMLVIGEVVLPLGGSVRIQQSSYATLEQFRGDVDRPTGPGGGGTGEAGDDGGGR